MRFILFITTFLIFFGTSFAQDKAAMPEIENALLWKIEGKELQEPSYLFGTIHMIPADDYFLSDAAKTAIKDCEQMTFEINLEDMMNIGSQLSLMMSAFMDNGTTLKDLLSEEEYKMVDEHFTEMGLPLFLLERIKPLFLSVFASGDMDMMGGMGSTADSTDNAVVSYEMELWDMAKEAEMSVGGLETAEYQMSMFDSIPYKAQADMLVAAIQSEDTDNGQFDQMVEMYKTQDLKAMGQMLSSEEDGVGDYEDILLETRNRNWIPVMGEQMHKQATFFAVGAGHLGGAVGVVNLLRLDGYKVTAIEPAKKLKP